jgi:hypothetical protein
MAFMRLRSENQLFLRRFVGFDAARRPRPRTSRPPRSAQGWSTKAAVTEAGAVVVMTILGAADAPPPRAPDAPKALLFENVLATAVEPLPLNASYGLIGLRTIHSSC